MHIIENVQHYPMGVVGTLIFLGFGVYATVWARRIQQHAIQWHERHPELARFNLFRRRIYRPAYLFELRVRYSLVPRWCPLLLGNVRRQMKLRDNRPNQSMKPTAPLRNNLSPFATAPCRGLSSSR